MSRDLRYIRVCVNESPYWEFVSRRNASEGVTIVALTEKDEIVLVSQYRVPLGATVIELPAGLVGDGARAETPEQVVARELLEETGYAVAVDNVRLLARGPALAGLTDEVNGLYLAPGARKTDNGGGVPGEGEAIDTLVVPLSEAMDRLRQCEREGCLVDLKVFAGLHFLSDAQR